MKTFFLFCVSLFLTTSARAAEAAVDALVFSEPPRLAITRIELETKKASPDFSKSRDAAIREGDELLAKPVEVPRGYGGWIFNYACPADGAPLKFISATEHQCPRDQKIYSDEKIVSAHRAFGHGAVERATQALGWAYIYSGDARYATEAKRL